MSIQESKTSPLFVPPTAPTGNNQLVPEIIRQRHEKTLKLYEKAFLRYVWDSQSADKRDSREKMSQELIGLSIPECVNYELLSIIRLVLPNNKRTPMFLNKDNEYDSNVKSCIVAKLACTILNEKSWKRGITDDPIHFCLYELGKLNAPIAELKHDDRDNVIDSQFNGLRPVFWLPDTKEQIEALEQQFGKAKQYKVAVAQTHGDTIIGTSIIPNRIEFVEGNVQNLIKANSKGLLSARKGGLQAYLNYQKLEDQLIAEGIAESKLAKLTRDDILEMLKAKERTEKDNGNIQSKHQKKSRPSN